MITGAPRESKLATSFKTTLKLGMQFLFRVTVRSQQLECFTCHSLGLKQAAQTITKPFKSPSFMKWAVKPHPASFSETFNSARDTEDRVSLVLGKQTGKQVTVYWAAPVNSANPWYRHFKVVSKRTGTEDLDRYHTDQWEVVLLDGGRNIATLCYSFMCSVTDPIDPSIMFEIKTVHVFLAIGWDAQDQKTFMINVDRMDVYFTSLIPLLKGARKLVTQSLNSEIQQHKECIVTPTVISSNLWVFFG